MDDDLIVERVSRTVIEGKLLTALETGEQVAILATRQDLDDLIAALYEHQPTPQDSRRRHALADGFSELRRQAFSKAL